MNSIAWFREAQGGENGDCENGWETFHLHHDHGKLSGAAM
jgi:hypothetical protein